MTRAGARPAALALVAALALPGCAQPPGGGGAPGAEESTAAPAPAAAATTVLSPQEAMRALIAAGAKPVRESEGPGAAAPPAAGLAAGPEAGPEAASEPTLAPAQAEDAAQAAIAAAVGEAVPLVRPVEIETLHIGAPRLSAAIGPNGLPAEPASAAPPPVADAVSGADFAPEADFSTTAVADAPLSWSEAEARVAPMPRMAQELIDGPGPGRGWGDLGVELLRRGRHEAALTAFTRGMTVEGVTERTVLGAARAMVALGRIGQAERLLAEAVRLWPESALARNNYGVTLHRNRRLVEAEREFSVAARIAADPGATVPSAMGDSVARSLGMVRAEIAAEEARRGRPLVPRAPDPDQAPAPAPATQAEPPLRTAALDRAATPATDASTEDSGTEDSGAQAAPLTETASAPPAATAVTPSADATTEPAASAETADTAAQTRTAE